MTIKPHVQHGEHTGYVNLPNEQGKARWVKMSVDQVINKEIPDMNWQCCKKPICECTDSGTIGLERFTTEYYKKTGFQEPVRMLELYPSQTGGMTTLRPCYSPAPPKKSIVGPMPVKK